ncbi:GNAT family N-acetyltransferase [Aphanothece hegewaldii CCALA 016]|uniref:GNAT family N-acetyltransferase n=1 Tax=Aphanothece hegewaldii CCALA 016 TaxID=2107694 RepID=A0A2T1M3X9_9CHRO|nr:GNAT family N-acetyltransferase [Aphanothece hegewaldii]PSF39460.1 GNAT family N-acetyltransferase [Aphanothece hegewaldii CCALA 016]
MYHPTIIIRSIQTEDELKQMFYLRWLILRKPLGKELGTEKDEYEQESFHIIALANQKVIGCARLRKTEQSTGLINYVAVLPEFRQQGIGTQMMQKLIEKAQQEQLKTLQLKARFQSVNFYKNLGFQETGETLDFLGILHFKMLIKLPER